MIVCARVREGGACIRVCTMQEHVHTYISTKYTLIWCDAVYIRMYTCTYIYVRIYVHVVGT